MDLKDIFFDIDDYYPTGKKLGKGSFGEVYVVQEKGGEKQYAAKIINQKELTLQDQILFLQESLILPKLNHPSIVRFYGINFHSFDNPTLLQPTILTEYIENCSLKNIIDNEKKGLANSNWNATKKCICLIGISNAFRYLHKEGIIHRDLKPDNILIDSNYYPIVCDFGLSKCFSEIFSNSIKFENSGMFGTPLYMAPEVIIEDFYGPCVDVYSFGMLAYYIVTGIEPFSKNGVKISFSNLISNISNGNRPEFIPGIPEKMINLISRCWSQNPKDRPSFDEIFNELTSSTSYSEYFNEEIDYNEISKYLEYIEEKIKQIKLKCKITGHEEIMRIKNENKTLVENNENLVKKVSALKEENSILEKERLTIAEENSKYTKIISDYKEKNELLVNENVKLKNANELSSKEITDLKARNELLIEENVTMREKNELSSKEITDLKARNELLVKENLSLTKNGSLNKSQKDSSNFIEKVKVINELKIDDNIIYLDTKVNVAKPQKIDKCNDQKRMKPPVKKSHLKKNVLNQDQNYENGKNEVDHIETNHPISLYFIRDENKEQDTKHDYMMTPNHQKRKRVKRNKSETDRNNNHNNDNDKISDVIEHKQTNPIKVMNRKQPQKRSSSVTREVSNKPFDQNDPAIINRKGCHYLFGKGVEQDYTKAFMYFQKAAKQNYPDAFFQLGYLYEQGLGVKQNHSNAIKCYTKAAEYNIPKAFYQLGKLYCNNDYSKAIKCYKIAAKMGVPEAFYNLGWLYETGEGVERDYLKAVGCFQKAALMNYPIAFYHLGYMHENGEGVDKNRDLAIEYYQKAADLGENVAITKIEELKKKI